MSSGWQCRLFDEVCTDETGGNLKTLQSDFASLGDYPIVDQGKDLIAGYTDDASRLCRANLPVVVFGDHTRAIKYIDFPFCLGADGTKVLRPRDGTDAKFLYHFLRHADIPSAGYSRYFKFLKRVSVPVPPLAEQRRIAAILDQADALRAKRHEALAQLDEIARAIFVEMFGDPIANDHGFPIRSLMEVIDPARPITYGILMPGPDFPDGVSYVRVIDMADGAVNLHTVRKTSPEIARQYERSKLGFARFVTV